MLTWTEDQVHALVTDAGSWQRGQQLARPGSWAKLGQSEAAAWGECAGSGKNPYLVGIDLHGPAFKCTCPSHVFPCKHGAGLLLLLARQPSLFTGPDAPAWVTEWLEKRHQSQEKKAAKAPAKIPEAAVASAIPALAGSQPGGEVSADPKRLARMEAGAADLATWLEDVVGTGLAALDQRPAGFWEAQAARLVDNQLPGLAAGLRELAPLRQTHADWPARLLARLGELYVLLRLFQQRAQLPAAARHDVLQQVGITVKKEDLAAQAAPVADEWRVLGQFAWDEDRLRARRSWLHGTHTGRHALVLDFAFGGQPFATPLVPQGRYTGELRYYPGPLPLRAAPGALAFAGSTPGTPTGSGPGQLLADYAQALARQPWLREWPATLAGGVPLRRADGSWALHFAAENLALPLRIPPATPAAGWELLGRSGGHPVAAFGEWDGQALLLLSHWETPGATTDSPAANLAAGVADPPATSPTAGPAPAAAPAPLPAWPQLLRVALLGTRQSSEVLPAPPGLPAGSPAQSLLLAAGTAALVQKAGWLPGPGALPPAPAPPETWTPLGPRGTELLAGLAQSNNPLLADYLPRLAARQRRVPHALLVPVLNALAYAGAPHCPARDALGTHGRWLAAQHAGWQFINAEPTATAAPELSWETGTLTARLDFLTALLTTDPARAGQLLADALPQEATETQVALLGPVAQLALQPLPADYAAWLEPLLASRAKTLRQAAAPLLARTAGNALVERLWARAAPLLTVKTKLLGRDQLRVALPDDYAADWQRDGIEPKVPGYPGGEKSALLGQLLALIPPQRWAAAWQVSPAKAVALAAASDHAGLLLLAWIRAALLHHDLDFARALLAQEAQHPSQDRALVLTLGRLLPAAERLAWVQSTLPANAAADENFYQWADWLNLVDIASPALLPRLLPLFCDVLARPEPNHWLSQKVRKHLHTLSEQADEALLPEFEARLRPLIGMHPSLAKELLADLELLTLRQQLTASLSEPA